MSRGPSHKYSAEQIRFISDNRTLVVGELTDAFNRTFKAQLSTTAMNATRKRHGFKTGRTGRFSKGSKSWNTGMKGLDVGGRSKETQFKKGSVPANVKPLGHERVCRKDGFIWIKVAETNPHTGHKTRYRPKHHVEWEKVNGPIPDGMVLRFMDCDPLNSDPANLEMVSMRLNLQMNMTGYASVPMEHKPTAKLINQVEVAVFVKRKQHQEEVS